MSQTAQSKLPDILQQHRTELLENWLVHLSADGGVRRRLIKEAELRDQAEEFLAAFSQATRQGNLTDIQAAEWTPVRELLGNLSRSRAKQGFTPLETAIFILSFKQVLFNHLRQTFAQDASALGQELWLATTLMDHLGLYTTEVHQKNREEIINRQQQELLELSTPVVRLWDGILALPLIGTLDSARTQVVMESLLQRIVETGAGLAIIDITGVPTVDTLVAQHLLKTVAAARLMGAECIISGIRPQIAQTIVHLGVDLGDVVTKATLADAFALALERTGRTVAARPAQA